MSNTLAVVTTTRADYGILYPLLLQIKQDDSFDLQLFVTGTHLSYEFGYTKDDIIKDGFDITEEVDCLISNDSAPAIGKTSALTLMGMTDVFNRYNPEFIIVLGDRYEVLCAAVAANLCRIPIIHLYGGEETEGAYDNSFRHAITKLSYLHFTSTEEYRRRVIQMGEDPARVVNAGALSMENIFSLSFFSKIDLEKSLNLSFSEKVILLTVHPETLNPGSSSSNVNIVIESLRKIKDCTIIITGTNADSEGRIINSKLINFSKESENVKYIENLGMQRYFSLLNYVNVVVGNSSSGIVEVPSFNIPTINLGIRQKGRIRAESVIDVEWNVEKITKAINNALSMNLTSIKNPFYNGVSSSIIMDAIKKTIDTSQDKVKKFYTL